MRVSRKKAVFVQIQLKIIFHGQFPEGIYFLEYKSLTSRGPSKMGCKVTVVAHGGNANLCINRVCGCTLKTGHR